MADTNANDQARRNEASRVASTDRLRVQREQLTRAELVREAIRLAGPAHEKPGPVPRPIYTSVANAFAYARWRNAAGKPDRGLEAVLAPFAKSGRLTVADCARLFLVLTSRSAGERVGPDGRPVSPPPPPVSKKRLEASRTRRGLVARFLLSRRGSNPDDTRDIDLATGLDVLARETRTIATAPTEAGRPAPSEDVAIVRDAARIGSAPVLAAQQVERIEAMLAIVEAAAKAPPARGTSMADRLRDAVAMLRHIRSRGIPVGGVLMKLEDVNPPLARRAAAALGT